MWTSGLVLAVGWVLFLAVALVRPVVRVWRQTGRLPVSFDRDPWQRAMGVVFTVLLLAVPAWGLALWRQGPEALWGWSPPEALAALGWVAMAASLGFVVVAQDQMGRAWQVGIGDHPTALVTTGLFRWVRNPIFTGMLGFAAGTVLVAPSPWLLGAGVLTWILLEVQVREEEAFLHERHGETYLAWATRTGRFLPGIGKLKGRPS